MAQAFLREGARVYINGRTDEGVAIALKKLEADAPNGQVFGRAWDFGSGKDIREAMDPLPEIDILINNVGIYTAQSFFETTDMDWHHQHEVNVMSGVRLSRCILPGMLERDWGRILFVSSECVGLVPSDLIAYSATKASLLAISRGLAQLTKGTGVTVNSVLPGSTMTEGAERFLASMAAEVNIPAEQAAARFFKEDRPTSLLQRFATVPEIANTIVYMASPLAAATNGAAIKMDGGSMGGIL